MASLYFIVDYVPWGKISPLDFRRVIFQAKPWGGSISPDADAMVAGHPVGSKNLPVDCTVPLQIA